MLGRREPEIYGATTLADIEKTMHQRAEAMEIAVDFRQSNNEGELVSWIQDAKDSRDAIIINAGAYSHSSIAILDALTLAGLPVFEVHISNIFRRQDFRRHSYISQVAQGVICGFGADGYTMALDAVHRMKQTP